MKIIALGTFDIRYSFGLDDSVLKNAAIDNLENLDGLNITFPDGKSGFYVDNPLGQGITIKIPANHSLLSKWKNALNRIELDTLIKQSLYELPTDNDLNLIKTQLAASLKNMEIEVEINILAIGVASITCVCNYQTKNRDDIEAFIVMLLYFALEYSAYFADISNEVKDIIDKFLKDIGIADSEIKEITKRNGPSETTSPLDSSIKSNNFFSSFTFVMELNSIDDHEVKIASMALIELSPSIPDEDYKIDVVGDKKETNSKDPNKIKDFKIGTDGMIRYGYAAISIEPDKKYPEMFEPLELFNYIRIAAIQNEAVRTIDNLISDRLAEFVNLDIKSKSDNKLEKDDVTFKEIALVRAIALSIVDRATFHRVTLLKDIERFLNRFSKDANVKEYQNAILRNSQSLYEVTRDMLEEKREERARVEEERAKIVQIILGGITALTVVSVASDVIGSLEFQGTLLDDKKWQLRTKWLLIIIPSVFLFMALLTLLCSKASSIRERNRRNRRKKKLK